MFIDLILRLMVYLFVKQGLKFSIEYNIIYIYKVFRDFVYMNVFMKKNNVVDNENLENFG
jgi:hypothetical protein